MWLHLGEKLLAILKVLSGKLLYLNPYDIAVLLEKSTANLCSITDEVGLVFACGFVKILSL